MYSEADRERFWAKVKKTNDGCWLWQAALFKSGYGQFRHAGTSKRAHRVAWELLHGEVPEDQDVCHSCDVRSCVRHLFLGSRKENMEDAVRKGRTATRSSHGRSKLTEMDVVYIREERARGRTQKSIADELGIDHSNVSKIERGETWSSM